MLCETYNLVKCQEDEFEILDDDGIALDYFCEAGVWTFIDSLGVYVPRRSKKLELSFEIHTTRVSDSHKVMLKDGLSTCFAYRSNKTVIDSDATDELISRFIDKHAKTNPMVVYVRVLYST